jgi:hypothetical protein
VAERDTAMASLNRMQAEASKVAGVRPVELPMPTAQTPSTTPTPGAQVAPGAGPDPEGFSKSLMSLDDPGLNDLTGKVVSKIEDLEMEFESYKQYGPKAAAQIAETRSALARARGHLVSIKAEAQRRESEKQQTRKAGDLKAQADKEVEVETRKNAERKALEAREIATLQANLGERGNKDVLPDNLDEAKRRFNEIVNVRPRRESEYNQRQADITQRFDRVMKVREGTLALAQDKASKPGKTEDPDKKKKDLISLHLRSAAEASRSYDFDRAKIEQDRAAMLLTELDPQGDGGAGSGGGYPSWMPEDPEKRARWDAMPDAEKQKVIKAKGQ